MEQFDLDILRQKHKPFTESELEFLYKAHKQETYKIESF